MRRITDSLASFYKTSPLSEIDSAKVETFVAAEPQNVSLSNLAVDGGLGIVGAVGNGGGNFGDVAALADGGYVVTWTNITAPDNVPAGFETSVNFVAARVFNADGTARTDTFQVNTTTDFEQTDARVTALNGGGFVVSFTNGPIADGSVEASAQIFDAQGLRVGTELQLNTVTTDDQAQPSIAALPDGGFIAVWVDARESGSNDRHLWGSYFDEEGNRIGEEFQIARFSTEEFHAEVTVSGDNIFIAGDSGVYLVTGEPLADSGTNILPVTRASVTNRQIGDEISIIGTNDGGALVFSRGNSNIEVTGVSQSGTVVFSDDLLDTETFIFDDARVDAVALTDGGFLAVWQQLVDDGSGTTTNNIYSQLIDANGRKFGTNQLVTTVTDGEQVEPWVTQLADGTVVIGWASNNQLTGAAPQDLYTQRFDLPADFAAANVAAGLAAGIAEGSVTAITEGSNNSSVFVDDTVGDVNGDGFADIVINDSRAPLDPDDANSLGQAYFVYGSADGFANLSLDDLANGAADQTFDLGLGIRGFTFDTIGDMNGDGLSEFIFRGEVGGDTRYAVVLGQDGGFSGRIDLSALDGTDGFLLPDESYFSDAFSTGDINGDGLTDLFIDSTDNNVVIYGQTSGFDASYDPATLTAEQGISIAREQDGYTINNFYASDVNGDGIDDLLISGFQDGSSQTVAYFGSSAGPSINENILTPTASQGRTTSFLETPFGISGAVDINMDGFSDNVRAVGTDDGGSALNFYFGSNEGFPADTDFSLTGIDPDFSYISTEADAFTSTLARYFTIDFNGDGLLDVGFTRQIRDENSSATIGEEVVILYGIDAASGEIEVNASTSFTIEYIGRNTTTPNLTNLGDVNGDGFEDFAYSVESTSFLQDGGSVIVYGRTNAENPGDGAINGDAGNNTLQGSAQGDVINGGGGNDILLGDIAPTLSLESIEGQVYRAYQAVFDRAPDLAGFNAFVQELRLGNLTQEAVITQFVGSTEFDTVYGTLDNQAFIEQLYLNLFNRAGDPQGVADFTETLNNGRSRADVVIELSNSPEFLALMTLPSAAFATNNIVHPAEGQVFRIYQAVFDRAPDADGFTNFVNSLQGEVLTPQAITAEFVASEEFQLTYGALGNTEFVNLLYTNVLPGNSDAQGRADFAEALEAGTLTRAEMVAEFAQSTELINSTTDALQSFVASVYSQSGDTLSGGTGNDILFGGRGADSFVFDTQEGGQDTVLDFTSGTDTLDLGANADFDSFAEIVSAGTQVGQDTMFDFGDGNTLTLENVTLSELTEADFGLLVG